MAIVLVVVANGVHQLMNHSAGVVAALAQRDEALGKVRVTANRGVAAVQ